MQYPPAANERCLPQQQSAPITPEWQQPREQRATPGKADCAMILLADEGTLSLTETLSAIGVQCSSRCACQKTCSLAEWQTPCAGSRRHLTKQLGTACSMTLLADKSTSSLAERLPAIGVQCSLCCAARCLPEDMPLLPASTRDVEALVHSPGCNYSQRPGRERKLDHQG